MALVGLHPFHEAIVDGDLTSVATGTVGCLRAPFRGKVIEVGTMLGGATTTADATVTTSIGSTNITGGAFVVSTSGSAAGQINFASASGIGNSGTTAGSTITAANLCNEGDAIKFTLSGSGTGGGPIYYYAIISRAF